MALARACRVNIQHIDTWFANKRSRSILSNKHKKSDGSHTNEHRSSTTVSLTEANLKEMLKQLEPLENELPIEKYLHTPLEEERADVSRFQQHLEEEVSFDTSRHDSLLHSTSGPGSISSLAYAAGSVGSATSRGSKKGRRQLQNSVKTLARTKDGYFRRLLKTEGRRFYCTFCGQCFRHHYEWKRHEESMHVPSRVWVCVISGCSAEDLDQRMFFRKDNFFTHVRRCHGFPEDTTNPMSPFCIDQFAVPLGPVPAGHPILKCGFCGRVELSWADRISHISKHFKKGIDLSSWWLRRLDCLLDQQMAQTPGLLDFELSNAAAAEASYHVWSCRFLSNASSAFDELDFCRYCSLHYADGPTSQLQHMIQEHKYRACGQELFGDVHDFHAHLVDSHDFEQPCLEDQTNLFSLFHAEIARQIRSS